MAHTNLHRLSGISYCSHQGRSLRANVGQRGVVNYCLQSVTTIVEEEIRELNWEGDDICTVLDILEDVGWLMSSKDCCALTK